MDVLIGRGGGGGGSNKQLNGQMCVVGRYRIASSNSYNMATRALADLSPEAPEGDKSVKRPRGHVITSLLQFKRTSA